MELRADARGSDVNLLLPVRELVLKVKWNLLLKLIKNNRSKTSFSSSPAFFFLPCIRTIFLDRFLL